MRDNDFRKRLGELRRKGDPSRAEPGKAAGLTGRAFSKWRNGKGKPMLDTVRKLAGILGVSPNDLPEESPEGKTVTRIVVTGGPCAGKTTAMSWIQNAFEEKGYTVLFVDETATQLITGGAAPWLSSSMKDFQRWLIHLQIEKEKSFAAIAKTMKSRKILIVSDRGTLDSRAYMTDADFRTMLKEMNTNEVSLRDRYDAVFHLVTAAKGAEEFYTLSNNAARTETPEKAVELDDRLIAAWTGHPHLRVIDNSSDFNTKMIRLIREISSVLGEPEPTENERKYLIRFPDVEALERRPNCRKVDILQIYLQDDREGEEIRIRQRGQDGHYIYTLTRKRKVSGGKRAELEKRLSQAEFLSLVPWADPALRPIRKQRYCLSENGLYYEIDIYPEWKDRAILEVEFRDDGREVKMPDGVEVIREVTDDESFTNYSLAGRQAVIR